jgi:hypothetical protein
MSESSETMKAGLERAPRSAVFSALGRVSVDVLESRRASGGPVCLLLSIIHGLPPIRVRFFIDGLRIRNGACRLRAPRATHGSAPTGSKPMVRDRNIPLRADSLGLILRARVRWET